MSRRPRSLTGARWLAIALVAGLAVIVITLSAFALQRSGGEVTSQPLPVPSFTLGVSTQSPPPASDPPVTEPSVVPADERYLAVGGEVWWRATSGSCGTTEPRVERSTDGGATWTDVTPRYLGVGQILSLNAFSAVDAEMIAEVGPTCERQALRTYTNGEFWEPYPDVLATSSFIDRANAGTVVLAGTPSPAPCQTPTGLRTSNETAGLICDGVPWVRTAADWAPFPITGSGSLTMNGSDVLVAHASDECGGTAISRVNASDPTVVQSTSCAPEAPTVAPSALAVSGGNVALWSGESVTTLDAAF